MLNPNRQTDRPPPTTGAIPGLETIEKWLRGLSRAEIRELREALANHSAERLAPFHHLFKAWLERSG